MNETMVTLQGWLGGDVTVRQAGDATVASFRVACTPRRYQKRTDEWVDAETQWYTVKAWRGLGVNCERSLRRGDPVVVHGRLNAQTWTNSANVEVTSFEVEATLVGHDLARGVSQFTRTPGPAQRPAEPGRDTGAPQGASPEGGIERGAQEAAA